LAKNLILAKDLLRVLEH